MMSFMLISDPPRLSLQSSKECRAFASMAAHCCSRVKHACTRMVTVQSEFFAINIHKESSQTPKMVKNKYIFELMIFRSVLAHLSFLLFTFWKMGKCESERKAISTCSGVDAASGPVCILSL